MLIFPKIFNLGTLFQDCPSRSLMNGLHHLFIYNMGFLNQIYGFLVLKFNT